jgi:hypothetical protein
MGHWGFPQTDDPIWKEHYAQLTEREKAFFREGLPRVLQAAGIAVVCKRSIPYIVDRISQFEPALWDYIVELVRLEANLAEPDEDDVKLYLRRFTGFYLLIPTLDNFQYSQLIVASLMSMGIATHKRISHWELGDVRAELQAYREQRRAGREDSGRD